MKRIFTFTLKKTILSLSLALGVSVASAQSTSVYDIISGSPDHTSLKAAIDAAGLDGALEDLNATYTVFAPDNDAFNDLANELGVTIPDLLNLPNLDDILLYHVLNSEVLSSAISNGDIVTPLFTDNTLKLTATTTGNVFINQAQVNAADLTANNGVVHSLNAVLVSDETVADIAIDNGFSTLVAAVIEAELLPALTDPFADLTVFAPDNDAFDDLANALGVTVPDLLELPNLADILLYHVLGTDVPSSLLSNGDIVQPLSNTNTLKVTITATGDVFLNQAQIAAVDISASNGLVHVIDAVVLPSETVADVAIDNSFTTLVAAVIEAELLPALTDPFAELTVFSPDNDAFDDLATELGVTVPDLLELPNLADILLYHVVGATVLSTDLTNGPVATLQGGDIVVDLTSGVMINDANVILADVTADNGVVHVLDKVLVPQTSNVNSFEIAQVNVYPNPTTESIIVKDVALGTNYTIVNTVGAVVAEGVLDGSSIDLTSLENGTYFIKLSGEEKMFQSRFVKL